MPYKIRMKVAEYVRGKSDLGMFGHKPAFRKSYETLMDARKAARRQVNFIQGFFMCEVLRGNETIGYVVFDSSYSWGGSSGIFWVPKGCDHEGYVANGVNVDGSLNRTAYKLT